MLKSVAGVVTGFILWSVLWLSYNTGLKKLAILPNDVTQPISDTKALLWLLAGSAVISLAAGYLAATVAQSKSNFVIMALGLLLLAVGLFFQIQYWHLMPLWYHLLFLALLLPLCLVGTRLRSS